ncbi:aminotransferase [Acinetobacter sp. ANC 5054]|uniref:aminotransferase n=1 Tax=Acinetobacter sp. ANC 5054 TaxID=1977877 RepID=UPI000A344034|nr:aminotransferase [Acinetobacter sp. ANC 5054]OTG83291.1 aminotransferase [Acinetobacter sp. ANC 5054]
MLFRQFSSFALFSVLSCSVFATVGGPQNIEVLGYDSKDQKIYLMRHFEDGRGRLPQLYYYQLNSKKPTQLITVRSLYINPVTKRIDYDQDSTQFDKSIANIKKRLIKLTPISNSNAQIQLITTMNGTAKSWYDPSETIDKWNYQYQVKSFQYKSSVQSAETYKEGINISKTYKIAQLPYRLVTVKYLGIPFETGYTVEDPVLLSK